MNTINRLGAAGGVLAVGLVVPAAPAGAATARPTDAPPSGLIEICNRSGYLFSVYADGPSQREDDLAGLSKSGECTDWAPVLAGSYSVGFGVRTASAQDMVIQARVKRDDHVFYKVFNREGVIPEAIGAGDRVQVDLFIPQG
ncbi:MAG TPA: hypothetical protein VHU88_22130 [Sporichthyaceae bacterium]|jgi:hypothetical protein|nr:hypothetical protein [Sporichthyaceae bacterium]